MLPDTGASVTIIDRSSYDKLCQTGAYPLFKTDARIFVYESDDPLKLKGYLNAQVSVKGTRVTITILCCVREGVETYLLLSKSACKALGVIEMCEVGEGSPLKFQVKKILIPQLTTYPQPTRYPEQIS